MKRAFTLVGFMIVMAIIAILAAITIPNFMDASFRQKIYNEIKRQKLSLSKDEMHDLTKIIVKEIQKRRTERKSEWALSLSVSSVLDGVDDISEGDVSDKLVQKRSSMPINVVSNKSGKTKKHHKITYVYPNGEKMVWESKGEVEILANGDYRFVKLGTKDEIVVCPRGSVIEETY